MHFLNFQHPHDIYLQQTNQNSNVCTTKAKPKYIVSRNQII